jgi:hypothetical protein
VCLATAVDQMLRRWCGGRCFTWGGLGDPGKSHGKHWGNDGNIWGKHMEHIGIWYNVMDKSWED